MVNRIRDLDNELSNKKHVGDSIGEGTIVTHNQALQNHLKVSVWNDTYNLTEYDNLQIKDTTKIKYPNTGGYLLQNWVMKCNENFF